MQLDVVVADEGLADLVEGENDEFSAAEAVCAFVERIFGAGASIIEIYNNRLKFRIDMEHVGLKLGDVFGLIEQNKVALKISDYAIGQVRRYVKYVWRNFFKNNNSE